jgi:acyl dehydratase
VSPVPPLHELPGLDQGTRLAHLRWPGVTRTQLAFYCAAAGVTDPIHFDLRTAAEHGFTDVVVNGSYRVGLIERAIELLWPDAELGALDCRHRGVLYAGRDLDAFVHLAGVHPDGRVTLRVEHECHGAPVDTCTVDLVHSGR